MIKIKPERVSLSFRGKQLSEEMAGLIVRLKKHYDKVRKSETRTKQNIDIVSEIISGS